MRDYDFEESSSAKSNSGCRCSIAVGFLLVLLAVAIAVGVGLIVHFAEKSGRDVTCNVQLAGPSADETIAGCVALAKGNHRTVCDACSSKPTVKTTTTTTTAKTTTPSPEVTTSATVAPPKTYPIRLTGTQVPISYTASLKPDFYGGNTTEFQIYGKSSALFTCLEDADEIIMHMRDQILTENSIIVREENESDNLFVSYTLYVPSDLIIIKTKSTLRKGRNYTVEFTEFTAPLRTDFNGIYLGSFIRNGTTDYHIASSFEPTFARMAFPCFDEPALKATFDITISRKSHVVAISNMPIAETRSDSDGWVHDVFERTPVMSTYLLVFLIGDFTSSSVNYKNRFPVSLWSREELSMYRNYTLEISPQFLEYFEDFFGVDYPLPKQDQVAILSFPAWAMENWGAIIYLEQYALYEEGVTSALGKFDMGWVIAHEISHNWFGNLVSPAWWDDIWLNEAFATYMQYSGVDHLQPEWKAFDLFMTYMSLRAMPMDARTGSHPVFVEGLEEANAIFAIFDDITYFKGGHLVRMVSKLVGDDVFAKGMKRYMRKHAYGNARHQDLWDAVQAEADIANVDLHIPTIMSTWLYQMGFPTLHVQFPSPGKLVLNQTRYLKDPTAQDTGLYTSDYGYKWNIPFTFTSMSEKKFDLPGEILVMNYTETSVEITSGRVPSPVGNNWVIANIQNLVFMQVNYDQRNWEALIAQLNNDHTAIHPTNRLQLVRDSWNLAKSDELSLDTALRVSAYMAKEREYGPWSILDREWKYLHAMLYEDPLYGKFHNYIQQTIRPAYADTANTTIYTLGLSQILTKARIMRIASDYGVKESIDRATTLVAEWMADPQNKPSSIEADLAETIYCTAVRYGGEAEWEFMLQVYRNSSLQAEKLWALAAMACSQQRWLTARLTSLLFNNAILDPADNDEVFNFIADFSNQPALLWDWMRLNYDHFLARLSPRVTTMALQHFLPYFNTERRLAEVLEFVREKQLEANPNILDALALVRDNIKWMKSSRQEFEAWLTDNEY